MSLAVHQLTYGYPGRAIGRNVSLNLEAGETLALLGPNGGGKTTLLKTMIGLLKPLDGIVTIDDEPLASLPFSERARRLAYVPQSHAGTFAFTALEVVLMGRTAHTSLFSAPSANDRNIAESMLQRLGIGHLAHKAYTLISGGERQLVLVARALAQQPRYVVLDEPTASLDFGNQGKVMQQIAALTSAGLGVLFTTHDPNQALNYANRVALLNEGQIISCGRVDEIITQASLAALYKTSITTYVGPDARNGYFPY